MPLSEHQWEITSPDGEVSLVFGTVDTGIQTRHAPDLGQRTVRSSDAALPREDGVAFGPDYTQGKTITFECNVLTNGPAEQSDTLNRLQAAWDYPGFRATFADYAILKSRMAGRTRRCYGRPRRFAEIDGDLAHLGYSGAIFDFATYDGKFYDDAETVLPLTLNPTSTGGLQGPLTDPLTIANSGQRYGEVNLRGQHTWAVATFHGPVLNPRLDFGDFTIGLDYDIAEGKSVSIDPRPWHRGVFGSDGENLSGRLTYDTPPMRDLKLKPGQYLVAYEGVDPTGTSRCNLAWRTAHSRP